MCVPVSARASAKVTKERTEYADLTPQQMAKKLKELEKEIYQYARDQEFEEVARIRDRIRTLQDLGCWHNGVQ